MGILGAFLQAFLQAFYRHFQGKLRQCKWALNDKVMNKKNGHHDIQYNDTRPNDSQHYNKNEALSKNETQHDESQHNESQHDSVLCWEPHSLLSCWVSLFWVSLCWASWRYICWCVVERIWSKSESNLQEENLIKLYLASFCNSFWSTNLSWS